MSAPYLCPKCGTNRSRFNVIEQIPQSVRLDMHTGEIIEYISPSDPIQVQYHGDRYRVQCGVCGLIETEEMFLRFAESHPLST
ncbi:DNA alkylation repair protein [Thermoactinomyces sp. DSM 45892]|uniref:DNA alkylation repair protein n=1 Tax=Thermoactinomyces sp. DSM 45892 TaxID=1882753 RepID=UPI00089A2BBD|nr:DNA alkylation repair protein [Thermoactinomyces sp. DSM 45892]SDY75430.1 hypothetical protein SAMN05444416_1086 [Thermoactinomyces sp. DSM 45892]